MPCSLQSTAHSLCSAAPLVCSTLTLLVVSLALLVVSLALLVVSLALLVVSLALLVVSLALLVVSLVQLSAVDLRLQRRLSLCQSVVLSKSPLSLGFLPSFRFPLCRHLYRHSGLSDRRLKTPLSCSLSYYRPLRPSIPLDYSASPTTRPSWATILTICPGVDHRLEDTYHQQDPLALCCLGQLLTPP